MSTYVLGNVLLQYNNDKILYLATYVQNLSYF